MINYLQNKKRKNEGSSKGGFSLIEVIVSVALFTVIVTIALGALLLVIDANRKAKAIKLVVNNLNLALEGMSRELRVGSYYCSYLSKVTDGTCDDTSGTDIVYYTSDQGEDYAAFWFDSTEGAVKRRRTSSDPYLQLTGSDVTINDLSFYIRGTATGDDVQPSILVILDGEVLVSSELYTFNIQTVVSQRELAF